MRIVLLTSCLNAGGAERVAVTLCNAWAARGDAVTLIPTYSRGGQPFYEVSPAVETIYLADAVGIKRKTAAGYPRRLLTLRRLIATRRPDVAVSFLPNVNVAAICATLGSGIPLVICERSDPSERAPFGFWEICCKLTYRFADMLTVQTDAVVEKARAIYPGLHAIRAIPNPLPEGVPAAQPAAGNARKILLSLGRLSPEKQVDRIIDAFAGIALRFSDWDLHVYGDGSEKSLLQVQVERLGLQGRVFFKGRTTQPWQAMAGADAFVMASKYEGFPNALLEAMGTGLPCVAVDCPSGPRDISRNGQDALLVPANGQEHLTAALEKLMSDGAFRHALGARARASVRSRFGLAAVIDAWDRVFDEVLPAARNPVGQADWKG